MPHFILDACGKDSQSIGTLHVYSQDGVEERVNTFKEPRPKALEVASHSGSSNYMLGKLPLHSPNDWQCLIDTLHTSLRCDKY